MPYQVIAAEGVSVSILKKVGDWKTPDGHIIQEDHESIPRLAGEVLQDDDVAPSVIALYEAGDPHVRSYLMRVDAKGAAQDDAPEKVLAAEEPSPEEPKIVSKDGSGNVKNTPAPASGSKASK